MALTIALVANSRIDLMAVGARFLKDVPKHYRLTASVSYPLIPVQQRHRIDSIKSTCWGQTYTLVEVYGVFAGNDISDGRAGFGFLGRHLRGGFGGRHLS